jgi:hypothetical protein
MPVSPSALAPSPSSLPPGATPFRARLLLLVLVAGVAACGRTAPEPPAPAVIQLAGSYSGNITVDGNFLPARMTVGQDGAALTLEFQVAEVGISTRGEGVAHTDRFTGRVPYQILCPGEAEFEGRLEEDGRLLTGTLRATDCDGTTNGTFRFTRQGS